MGSIYDVVTPNYAFYVNGMDDNDLCGTLVAAHKLNIDPLVDLLSAKLAITIYPLSMEKKREFFGIQSGFTEQELA